VVKSTTVDSFYQKTISSTHRERLLVYYHSHKPKTLFFLSFGENQNLSGERKLVPRGKKKISFFFIFVRGVLNPLIRDGGILQPKRKKKKEISMIGYAAHVPNSGGGGCWDPFPPL
jgi:hypothetical protein